MISAWLARPMLAWIFVYGGFDAFRKPEPRAKLAGPMIDRMLTLVPFPGADRVRMVQANGLLQVVAGATMALGIGPRISALVLTGSLVPTTMGGHRFWEVGDPAQRAQQRTHFNKNLAMLGGLIAVASIRRSQR